MKMTQKGNIFDPTRLAVVYHPGETLEEKLQEMGMSVKEFATRVSKPEKTIIAVLKGRSAVTPDMAVAFEPVTRIPADMWLRCQNIYDEYEARRKRREAQKAGRQWAEKFPVEEMTRLGWLAGFAATGGESGEVEMLCAFFGVSSPKGWEDFYLKRKLLVAFRVTLSEVCDPYALSAWLRQGELQAGEMTLTAKYTAKALRGVLHEVADALRSTGREVHERVVELLSKAGVKLVFTPALSTAPVKGCMRYIHGEPCIQLATAFATEEEMRHTLFHEIGHVLLHGKKDVFMENVAYGDKDEEKEREADEFARKWTRC